MLQSMLPLGWVPGPAEWMIIAAFGLILFGKRLPEVGRSLGKGIVEFKKGLKGVEDEVEEASNRPAVTHKGTKPVEHKVDEVEAEKKAAETEAEKHA
jgi:sec-independent protein translocase protein TatA